MTGLNISEIKNATLKQAAEKSDASLDNKLDSNELIDFVQTAVKEGCNMTDVMEIVDKVGIEKSDTVMPQKVKQMQDIFKLKNDIKAKKLELNRRKQHHSNLEPRANTAQEGGCLAGAIAGMYAGLKITGAVAATGAGALVMLPVALVSVLGCAAIGGYLGYKGGDYASRPFESHERTVQRKQAADYETNEIEPLKAEIKKMEEELEAKENEFYS